MGLVAEEPTYPSLLLVGPVALLLLVGVVCRGLIPVLKGIPHSVVGGTLGAVAYAAVPGLESSAGSLASLTTGVLNALTFAGVILGFGSPSTKALRREARQIGAAAGGIRQSTLPRLLGVDGSLRWRLWQWARRVWHAAVPQLVYSQTLAWAQVAVAVSVVALAGGSEGLGAAVAVGLDMGFQSVSAASALSQLFPNAMDFSLTADACGVVIGLACGLTLVWSRLHPGRGLALAWPRRALAASGGGGVSVNAEAFSRGNPLAPQPGAGVQRQQSRPRSAGEAPSSEVETLRRRVRASQEVTDVEAQADADAVAALSGGSLSGEEDARQWGRGELSMGLHLIVLALAVFAGDLLLRFEYWADHEWLQYVLGYRLFPLAMIAGILIIHGATQREIGLNRAWFHRFSGTCLSILVVVLLTTLRFPASEADDWSDNRVPFALAVAACALWQVGCYVLLAPVLFPRFWPERGIAELGHCLGDAWLGLLLVKAIDPALQTPAPRNFVYRLIIVPLAGSVRALIVLRLTTSLGAGYAGAISAGVACFWLAVYRVVYRERWAVVKRKPAGSRGAEEPLLVQQADHESSSSESGRSSAGSAAAHAHAQPEAPLPALRGGDSAILTLEHLRLLQDALPPTLQLRDWQLAYSLQEHGAALSTLYHQTADGAPSLVVVQDSWGYALGGFSPDGFRQHPSYHGRAGSFVFRLSGVPRVYRSANANEMYVYCTPKALGMGGGGGGFAFFLDAELDNGTSAKSCETFASECLASSEYFSCVNVEVWSLR